MEDAVKNIYPYRRTEGHKAYGKPKVAITFGTDLFRQIRLRAEMEHISFSAMVRKLCETQLKDTTHDKS